MRVSIPDQIAAKHGIPITIGRERWERRESRFSRPRKARFHWGVITVRADLCQTRLGSVLAKLPAMDGNVRLRCLSKTEWDKPFINGAQPGTAEHAALLEMWDIKNVPIVTTVRLCGTYRPDLETPEGFCDRIAHQIAGDWANEIYDIIDQENERIIAAAMTIVWSENDEQLAAAIIQS